MSQIELQTAGNLILELTHCPLRDMPVTFKRCNFATFSNDWYIQHFKWNCVWLNMGAVTCAVCPESAWLVTFLIGNVSTGVVTWSALRCSASGESGKKVAAAPLSKTAAAAAAAKTWFVKHPLDYMLHNRFPWKRSSRRSSMWPPYSLRRNLSAAACRPCDRSLTQDLLMFYKSTLVQVMAWYCQVTSHYLSQYLICICVV